MTIVRRQIQVISGGISEVSADIGGMDPSESLLLKNAFFDTPSTVTVRGGSVDGDVLHDDNGVPVPVTSIPYLDFFPVQGRIFGISHSTIEDKHYGFEATTEGLNPTTPATPIPPIAIPVNGAFTYETAEPVIFGGAGWYNKRCYVHDILGDIGMLVFNGDLGTITFPNFTIGGGPAAPLRPVWLFNHKNHLILLGYGDENTPKALDLMRSSVLGDPDQFLAEDNFNIGNTQEPLITGISVGDFALLFKQFQIFRMGGSAAIDWSFTEIDPDRGIVDSPRALTYYEDFVWFLANEGFARVGLSGPAELLVDKAKLSFASFDNLKNCWVNANVPERMIVFACHESGSAEEFPNLLVQLDVRTGNFVTREYQDTGPVPFVAMSAARVPQVAGVATGLGPLGPPTIQPPTSVVALGWDSNWINGDLTPLTTTRHETRNVDAGDTFAEDASELVPVITTPIVVASAGTLYEERVRHERNSIFSIFSPATGGQEVKTPGLAPAIAFAGITSFNVTISIFHNNAAGFWDIELEETIGPPSCPSGAPSYTTIATIFGSSQSELIVVPVTSGFANQYRAKLVRPTPVGFPDSAFSNEICAVIP